MLRTAASLSLSRATGACSHAAAARTVLSSSWAAASAACATAAASSTTAAPMPWTGVRRMASKPYSGKKKGGEGKKKNTFGSNEYRKKRALERQRRAGIDMNIADVPIQSVWGGGSSAGGSGVSGDGGSLASSQFQPRFPPRGARQPQQPRSAQQPQQPRSAQQPQPQQPRDTQQPQQPRGGGEQRRDVTPLERDVAPTERDIAPQEHRSSVSGGGKSGLTGGGSVTGSVSGGVSGGDGGSVGGSADGSVVGGGAIRWEDDGSRGEGFAPRKGSGGGRRERQQRERESGLFLERRGAGNGTPRQGPGADDGPFDPRTRDLKPVPLDAADARPLGHIAPPSAEAVAAAHCAPPASAAMCCGCGAAFQSAFQDSPGFLPPDQLEKFVERRTAVYEERVAEEEAKRRRAAEAEEAAKRKALRQLKGEPEDAEPATHEAEEAGPEGTSVDVQANSIQVENSSGGLASAAGPTTHSPSRPTPPPFWSSTLHPHLARQAKLDPKRPLPEQDLSIALNYGLVDEAALLAHGLAPEMIMSKRELNALERKERDELREKRGDGTALRCLRCFQLQNYGYTKGQVASVRAEDFRTLLRSRFLERGGRSSVILKVVDLFDFHGSFIRDFSQVVGGRNPVILVANKFDLLPSGVGENRLRAWIKAEADKYGLHYHSVEIVSAQTGHGLFQLVRHAQELAEPDPLYDRPRRDIYIVGTTNVGKSSIVNKLIEKRLITSKGQFQATRIRTEEGVAAEAGGGEGRGMYLSASSFMPISAVAGTANLPGIGSSSASIGGSDAATLHSAFNVLGGKMTASIVPGTTLGMVSFPFVPSYAKAGEAGAAAGSGAKEKKASTVQHVLYDTPGVINPEQLSSILTFHELRACMPKRQVQPLTYRLTRGQCLLLGGLARLDFVSGDRDYAFVTVFASRNVTVHISQIERMDTVQERKTKKRVVEAVDGAGASVDSEQAATAAAETAAAAAPAESAAAAAATADAAESAESESPPEIGYLEFIKKHAGTLIYPPFTPERAREIGLHTGTRVSFDFHGRGWMEACEDVVFPGLGWVSVTGSGQLTVRAILPGQTRAYAREPLMPYESRHNMKKWTGSAVRQH